MSKNIPAPIFNEFSAKSVEELLGIKKPSKSLVDKINQLATSVELSESYKDNLVTFTSVLTKGAFTPAQYVSAVQYVSYRLMGQTIQDAWRKTFPERYQTLLSKGTPAKDISSHASAYNKTKLVNLITEQSLIPSYIINNHYFQEALDVQVSIMRDHTQSGKVRSDAAAKVKEYTVMPDAIITNKEEVSSKGMDIIAELAKSVTALAEGKRTSIIEGRATAQEIARKPVYQIEDAELISE